MNTRPLLHVEKLSKHFQIGQRTFFGRSCTVFAIDRLSFDLMPGETLGVVGESGCGKSTLGRTVMRLVSSTAGRIFFDGKDITHLKGRALKRLRPLMQIVFQDPYASLNPRISIGKIVGDALRAHVNASRSEIYDNVGDMLEKVGISRGKMNLFPHELSGGQRQRVAIARALILRPKMIVCDEPVSALDVSIQAQVLNLLTDLGALFNLSYLMISHDMAVVKHISDRILVMYLGQAIELAHSPDLLKNAMHPYTRALISAIPVMDPEQKRRRIVLNGEIPGAMKPPSGCRFHTRCWKVSKICRHIEPSMVEAGAGHFVKCHLYK